MLPSEGHVGPGRRGASAALWYEVALLERLLYKNKNQHRHTLHFQRLQQVHRILMIVRKSSTATAALEELVGKKRGGMSHELHNTITSNENLRGGFGRRRLLEQLLMAIEAASKALGALLAQSFFMPFALTVLACLARIHAIVCQAAESLKGRGKTPTGVLEAARETTAPPSVRILDSRLSSGTPPVQRLRPEAPVFPVRETLQTSALPKSTGAMPQMGPPGFFIPRFGVAGLDETGIEDSGVSESPPAKRVRLSDEARGLGEPTRDASLSAQEGATQERGVLGSIDGGIPGETGGISFISNETTLRSETFGSPVSQAATIVEESARKKRAADWLEDLGLEALTPTRDTWQGEKASTGLQQHRKSGPLQGTISKDESKVGDFAGDLLAGTDFEGFGGTANFERTRGKKRMKARKG